MQPQPLPGFRDFYPADLAFRNYLFDTWRKVCRGYGFEEFDGPPLEPLELYTAKSGEEIVGQLYNFVDKGGREVALRPELTPTVARMVAAHAGGMKKPIRWFSIGQMFRYERQQKGRLREFYQLNCDLIGEDQYPADAEIIALAIDLIRAFGFDETQVRIRVSDRALLGALLEGIGLTEDQVPAAYAVLDKVHRMRPEQRDEIRQGKDPRLGPRGAGVLELAKLKSWSDVVQALGKTPNAAGARDRFANVLGCLRDAGLDRFIDVDVTIVRGLAYYTGTVFEVFDASGSLRAIAGGGRYDKLLEMLGGVDLPAVGFAVGDVVLGELLRSSGRGPAARPAIDVFVAGVTIEDRPQVLRTVHELREAEVRVEYSLRNEALGKQLKLADTRGARFAVVIGPDDRARSEVQLKDLAAKTQRAVAAAALVGELTRQLGSST
ncbi:MAG TPA: histidine--tRNA ligase [Gemmatimonadales bacterium]|nr:histidine--tRNA ligase [Gemmatimonadales bacterium]